jgi:hypothetical protein
MTTVECSLLLNELRDMIIMQSQGGGDANGMVQIQIPVEKVFQYQVACGLASDDLNDAIDFTWSDEGEEPVGIMESEQEDMARHDDEMDSRTPDDDAPLEDDDYQKPESGYDEYLVNNP